MRHNAEFSYDNILKGTTRLHGVYRGYARTCMIFYLSSNFIVQVNYKEF